MDKEKGKRKLQENSKRKNKEKSQPGGSLYLGLKNQQEWRMADHNGSTDVSTTSLLGVLDTNHHVSHVPGLSSGLETSLEFSRGGVHHQHSHVRLICSTARHTSSQTSLNYSVTFTGVADPDQESGIRCLLDPWIKDPGWVKNQDPGSGYGMSNPDDISESLES
jgi:hypothetical protein